MEFHLRGSLGAPFGEVPAATFLLQRRLERVRASLGFNDSDQATVPDTAQNTLTLVAESILLMV